MRALLMCKDVRASATVDRIQHRGRSSFTNGRRLWHVVVYEDK